MSVPNQIVFNQGSEHFAADGSSLKRVTIGGVGCPLPLGMRAWYDVLVEADGRVLVQGIKQARSKHGKRNIDAFGPDAESRVQRELLNWSKRILRELSKEQS